MPFLSVIIPVYNVEAYLRQCVDSVLRQELDDYEIILVDDGSTDASPQICDEYKARVPQVRVIHQENGGLSAARNAGLRIAAGQYIVFMDSDDWWNLDVSVKEIMSSVKSQPDVDVFLFSGLDYIEEEGFYERGDSIAGLGNNRYDAVTYYQTMLSLGNLQVSAATKILKASFLQANRLFFLQGIKGEDNDWMIRVLRSTPAIVTLPDKLYICRLGRQDSITNTIKSSNISDLLHIIGDSVAYYALPGVDRTLMQYEFCFCAYLWFCALGLSWELGRAERAELLPVFKETAQVCRFSNSRKTRLAYFVYRVFGLRVAMLVLGCYIRFKGLLRLNKVRVSNAAADRFHTDL